MDEQSPIYLIPQSLNRYAYVINGPTRYKDSDGREVDSWHDEVIFGGGPMPSEGAPVNPGGGERSGLKPGANGPLAKLIWELQGYGQGRGTTQMSQSNHFKILVAEYLLPRGTSLPLGYNPGDGSWTGTGPRHGGHLLNKILFEGESDFPAPPKPEKFVSTPDSNLQELGGELRGPVFGGHRLAMELFGNTSP